MCVFAKQFKNLRYYHKGKDGMLRVPGDARLSGILAPCGTCLDCRKQKAKDWMLRLEEEAKQHKHSVFVTLTFSEEELNKLVAEVGDDDRAVAKIAVKRFRERWRKKYKVSPRHWLITELGHKNTERLHLHGILYIEKEQEEDVKKLWKYGEQVYLGYSMSTKCRRYVVKYITKADYDHEGYRGSVLASPGIGREFVNEKTRNEYRFRYEETLDYLRAPNGTKTAMPKYYRDKFLSIEEREWLRLYRDNQQVKYLRGNKYDMRTAEGVREYKAAVDQRKRELLMMKCGPSKRRRYAASRWKAKQVMSEYVKEKYGILSENDLFKFGLVEGSATRAVKIKEGESSSPTSGVDGATTIKWWDKNYYWSCPF